jgi:glycosyltransferase involved in cell wall biosynthesis
VNALRYDVVVPTAGRESLASMLPALAAGDGPLPGRVLLVDDRREPTTPLAGPRHLGALAGRVQVVRGPGRGPAAARNAGWRASGADWVAFLDDDVIPPRGTAGRRIGSATSPGSRRRAGRPRTWPTGETRWSRSAASTSASRARTARTPTSRCA